MRSSVFHPHSLTYITKMGCSSITLSAVASRPIYIGSYTICHSINTFLKRVLETFLSAPLMGFVMILERVSKIKDITMTAILFITWLISAHGLMVMNIFLSIVWHCYLLYYACLINAEVSLLCHTRLSML